MPVSRVDGEAGKAVLVALQEGASIADAAERGGVPEKTVRNWIREGRLRPEGRFGRIAAVADVPRSRFTVLESDAPLDQAEWELLLTKRCREGNVAALRLWRDAYGHAPKRPLADDENWRRLMVVTPEAS